MKLVRFGAPGAERPGVITEEGSLRDLSAVMVDLSPGTLAAGALTTLASLDCRKLPEVTTRPRLGPPIANVGKFIAIGLNYRDHAAEAGMPIPEEPVIFMKATSCVVGPDDAVVLPPKSQKTDFEVELGIVIGKRAAYVPVEKALEHVAGYLVVHDVSERSYKLERGGQWDKGKGCDTFGPLGPWLVTRDEVPDPQTLDLWLKLNGKVMQQGNTRTMIFSCAYLVSYVSQFMSLNPGDIITTGTPPGVGMGRKPPVYLKPGDTVELGITGLGSQTQRVLASQPEAG
jgi:2,4-didehydro-3-deoxy-L-rhamnonate hydrolase